MSDLNVNTPVVADGSPQTVNGGESAVLFDDLTSAFGQTSNKVEKSENKASESKDDKKESKPAKEKDLTDDTQKSKAKEAGKEKAKDQVEEKETKEAKLERKMFKAKSGDKEIDLDEETLIPVKINGKEEWVSASELKANYSGKTNWSKQFQDLSTTKKEIADIESKISLKNDKIKSAFEEKDPNIRLYKMAQIAGVDPTEFRSRFLEDNVGLLEKYYSMTDDERKADALKFENTVLKHQNDTRKQGEAKSQAEMQLKAKTDQLLASHKMAPEEFESQKEAIASLVKQGALKPEQITPEFIVETKIKDNLWMKAAEAAQASGITVKDQEMVSLIDQAYSFGLGADDMPEIISDIYGKGKTKRIVDEKVAQAEEFKTGRKPNETRKETPNNEVWNFDQI